MSRLLPLRWLLILLLVSTAACTHRIPSTHQSERLIRNYFTHYGKLYPATPFGGHRVTKVEFLSLDEIQKDLAQAEVFLSLAGNEDQLMKARITFKKRTLRWKILYWEDLSPMPQQTTNPPPT